MAETNPQKVILIGQQDEKRVYIEYAAYLKILKFGKGGASDGARGVLLGEKKENEIYISALLEAVYTGGDGVEAPSFTTDSWDRIKQEREMLYPNLTILGSYSTHPDVHPTEQDILLQNGFFNEPGNILFVFDPIANVERVYICEKEKWRRVKGFYLYDMTGRSIDLRLRENLTRTVDKEVELRNKVFHSLSKRVSNITAAFSICILLLAIVNVYLVVQVYQSSKMVAAIQQEASALREEIKAAVDAVPQVMPTATPKPTQSVAPARTEDAEETQSPRATQQPAQSPRQSGTPAATHTPAE